MTDISTDTPEPDDEPSGDESPVIAQLRKDAAEGKAALKKLAALERDRAFDKAGVPEDGAGKWFRKGYDGDVDVEAIRQAAAEDGLIAVPDQTDPEVVEHAFQESGRIARAAEGTQASPSVEALLGDAKTMDEIEAIANNAGVGVPIR